MKVDQTIFVTGSTGYLGGHFLKLATHHSWQLYCLVRKPPRYRMPHVKWIRGDLLQDSHWIRKLEGCSMIVHLATCPLLECERNPLLAADVIVGGLDRILEGAIKHGIKHFILASTAEVYGSPSRLPITETTPLKPRSIYGFFKACADLHAFVQAKEHHLSVCALRFFNLYGRAACGETPSSIFNLFARQILQGKPVVLHASYCNSRDFIHVKDAAQALWKAIQNKNAQGIINIGSGRETFLQDAAQKLADMAGRHLEIDFRPHEGRLRRMVAGGQRAHKILNFVPKVSLDQGMREVLDDGARKIRKIS